MVHDANLHPQQAMTEGLGQDETAQQLNCRENRKKTPVFAEDEWFCQWLAAFFSFLGTRIGLRCQINGQHTGMANGRIRMREAAGICRSKASQQTFEIFQITRSPHLTVFQAVSLKVRPKPRPLPPVSTGLKPRRSELPVSVAHGSYFFQGNKVRSSSQFSLLFKILIRININHTSHINIILNHESLQECMDVDTS